MDKSQLFKLNTQDFLKGLVTAVLAGVLTYFLQLLNAPGFSFVGINWAEIMRIGIASGGAYLMKNLLSDSNGKFGGIL